MEVAEVLEPKSGLEPETSVHRRREVTVVARVSL
jgi:hypothetical protein